jgi:hypothetical protein
VNDAVDYSSVIDLLLSPNVGRQMGFDPRPLLIA